MILLIDNYDSFTYNLYQYLSEFEKVKVFRNDCISLEDIEALKPDKIVLSPGPKTPLEAGICIDVVKRFYKHIPILGICLGHQCIGHAFGGDIVQAKKICHGKVDSVTHDNSLVFKGLSNPFTGARYHSLAIKRGNLPKELKIIAEVQDGEIMAVKHEKYPLIGLQFHPESVLTTEGMKIIQNFIKI
ncbi:aminodeoxychorismate/anthranilate synthase component II [Clostridium sediminicola]|uniref:anthranilate synthase component II n=1 Tax=Clostridium sediminicola TaxID=3114879 RepID=UPI0031F1E11A